MKARGEAGRAADCMTSDPAAEHTNTGSGGGRHTYQRDHQSYHGQRFSWSIEMSVWQRNNDFSYWCVNVCGRGRGDGRRRSERNRYLLNGLI